MATDDDRMSRTPDLMSTAEVAAYFGRTTRTIRNWTRAGVLHPRRIGGSVFFRRAEIEKVRGSSEDLIIENSEDSVIGKKQETQSN